MILKNTERKHRTNVYIMIVDKELTEWEENTKYGRIRKWFHLDEAKRELDLHKPVQAAYLTYLKGFQSPTSSSNRNLISNSSVNNDVNNVNSQLNGDSSDGNNNSSVRQSSAKLVARKSSSSSLTSTKEIANTAASAISMPSPTSVRF